MLNPFGLLNNNPLQVVRVEDVERGLACDCYCAACGGRFVAVKPDSGSVMPHFKHHVKGNCLASFESAVHLLAKAVLVSTKTLMLPYLDVRTSKRLRKPGGTVIKRRILNRQKMTFDRVESEVCMDGRTPDIVMWKGSRKLLVEIVVTHDISPEKRDWVRSQDVAMLRINLTWAGYDLAAGMLAKCFETGQAVGVYPAINIVSWVHNPLEAVEQKSVDDEYIAKLPKDVRLDSPPQLKHDTPQAALANQPRSKPDPRLSNEAYP